MTTTSAGMDANSSRGRLGILFVGTETTTTSWPRTASSIAAARAPVSADRSAKDSGPRELAIVTSCPAARKRRVSALPILPAPTMPIFMFVPFEDVRDESADKLYGPLHSIDKWRHETDSPNQECGMDRLASMAAFVKAAEGGSFATAASALGISPQMVAKHVTYLEARLGARLLNR